MIRCLPGTVLPAHGYKESDAYGLISPLFTLTKGITLSQVCHITGLETSTVQNWVKRGWVANPVNKKYSEIHLIRIILINSLRGALKLEDIHTLMTYINGEVENTDDDIIEDIRLYNYFCRIIFKWDKSPAADFEFIDELIKKEIADFTTDKKQDTEKLTNTLKVMVYGFISSQLKEKTDMEFNNIK